MDLLDSTNRICGIFRNVFFKTKTGRWERLMRRLINAPSS